MPYATQQDCIDKFGTDIVTVATDHDGNGVIDTAVLATALANATATMDSYVCGLPGFPFAHVPDAFKGICCDIAMYYASITAHTVTEEQRKRYEDHIKYLTLVAQQKIRLSTESGQTVVESNSTATIIGSDRVFTRTKLDSLF